MGAWTKVGAVFGTKTSRDMLPVSVAVVSWVGETYHRDYHAIRAQFAIAPLCKILWVQWFSWGSTGSIRGQGGIGAWWVEFG
jgi:hypothetical protein